MDCAFVAARRAGGAFAQAFQGARAAGKAGVSGLRRHHLPGETAEVDLGALTPSEKEILTSYSSSVDLQDLAAALVFGRRDPRPRARDPRFPMERRPRGFRLAAAPGPGVLKVVVGGQSG